MTVEKKRDLACSSYNFTAEKSYTVKLLAIDTTVSISGC